MNPITATFDAQRILVGILALIIWSLLCAGTGYLYKGHRVAIAEAERNATQQAATTTATAATTAVDTQALSKMQNALAAAKTKAATLEQLLKAQSHATPAPVDCRLNDGLRDQINADLAAGAR